MQQADRSVVLNKIAQQIADTRLSIAYAEQQLNRECNERHMRAQRIVEQRREELALWLAVYDFALTAQPDSMQRAHAIGPDQNKPDYLYGTETHRTELREQVARAQSWTDAPNAMMRTVAMTGLVEQAVDNERPREHPQN